MTVIVVTSEAAGEATPRLRSAGLNSSLGSALGDGVDEATESASTCCESRFFSNSKTCLVRDVEQSLPSCLSSMACRFSMYSTAWRSVSTLDIFLCLAAEGMWLRRTSKPQLTCFTRFRSRRLRRSTLAGCTGGMAYPRVGWKAILRRHDPPPPLEEEVEEETVAGGLLSAGIFGARALGGDVETITADCGFRCTSV